MTLVFLLPASAVKNWLLRCCGCRIGRNTRIGPVLVLGKPAVEIGDGCDIAWGNGIKGVRHLCMGDGARIGQWNWLTVSPTFATATDGGWIRFGRHSSLTTRHFLDASGGIAIGEFSTVSGVRSTLMTHGIDWVVSGQRARPIVIGAYCLLGSNVLVAPGTTLADRTVVAMGATVSGSWEQTDVLLLSRRADVVREVHGDYFRRPTGFVDATPAERPGAPDPREQ
jgi:acetyltransferase-like isoleucine patch superfamily enzyme